MSLNIKNPEVVRLARTVAAASDESLTEAVEVALRERLERLQRGDTTTRLQRLKAIRVDAGRRWADPGATADHGDLLYDEQGLPR